ncbi:MAG: hypothetical protein ACR2JB_13125 [Bryobacteraceae bacterium]
MNSIEENGSGYKQPLGGLDVLATSPQSLGADRRTYLTQVRKWLSRASKAARIRTLVCTGNSILDPWLIPQITIENTESLWSLVAVPANLYESMQPCRR